MIKRWLKDNGHKKTVALSLDEKAYIIEQCFNDLQGWVSVDTEPKENGSYIVNTVEDGVIELEFYKCPEYENFNWHCPVTHDDVAHTVTHWQPMPLPPAK